MMHVIFMFTMYELYRMMSYTSYMMMYELWCMSYDDVR